MNVAPWIIWSFILNYIWICLLRQKRNKVPKKLRKPSKHHPHHERSLWSHTHRPIMHPEPHSHVFTSEPCHFPASDPGSSAVPWDWLPVNRSYRKQQQQLSLVAQRLSGMTPSSRLFIICNARVKESCGQTLFRLIFIIKCLDVCELILPSSLTSHI